MLNNFFKIAVRNLRKNSLHSFINIIGLAVGMYATLLIASFVFFELSYDKYNTNYKNIYRIHSHITMPNGTNEIAPTTIGNIGSVLEDRIPEIKKTVRIFDQDQELRYEEQVYHLDKFFWVDSTLFDIFSCEIIEGNMETALIEPASVVLTESIAEKVLGAQSALNSTVMLFDESFKVTAIVEDQPLNSHFHFNALGSFSTVNKENNNFVNSNGFDFYTYLLCDNNSDPNLVAQKVNDLVSPIIDERFGAYGIKVNTFLKPLSEIHLRSQTYFELEAGGDINNVYIFSLLAIFIIIIAIINFINLVTANSESRAKEIGLRKVMGAYRKNLFYQFISESILVSFLAFIIAISITELCIDSFRTLMDSPIILPYKSNPVVLVYLMLIVIVVGFISGAYPALYLSKFSPSNALKGTKSSGTKNVLLRKVLVVFQFTIAIFLLTNLALLYQQVHFLKNKELGFDKDQVLVVDGFTKKISNSYLSLKANLLSNPRVLSVTASHSVPGEKRSVQAGHLKGEDSNSSIMIHDNRVQYDYIKTYGIELLAGRDFSEDYGNEERNYILNETAVKVLGIKGNPIGQKVIITSVEGNVIGVMKDFNFKSLHESVAPLVFTMYSPNFKNISIKLNTDDIQSTLTFIEKSFSETDPNNTFQYSFIDQKFSKMYEAEEKSNLLITWGGVLAIIISVLGLFGLTSFTIYQKKQEIGLRKVMGASVPGLLQMFVKEQSKLVLISCLIAFPLAYYSMDKWLDNFVYQTNISIWMFLYAGLSALIIAAATVGFISNKAAQANPVESLKYE